MPNIKSAVKRVKINEKKQAQNVAFKSKLSTYIKKFNKAVTAKDSAEAEKLFAETISLIDKAVAANLLHKNNAARKKSSLSLKLKTIDAKQVAKATSAPKAAKAPKATVAKKPATVKKAPAKAPAKK